MEKNNEEKFEITFDHEVAEVLAETKVSILLSTYHVGRLIAIGTSDGSKLHQIPIPLKRPMGITVEDDVMAIACLDEVQIMANSDEIRKQKQVNEKNFDAFFVHRATYNTATIDVHDIAFGKGKLWAVNTAFSCLCTLDLTQSFTPKWKPSFITDLVPEDRCHLNGMAMKDGLPRFVTALGVTDSKEGWRKNIMNGGVLLEVPSGNIVLQNLAMPHSPRFYNDQLYVITSGDGKLLKVDVENQKSEVVYEFGSFIRGLDFKGKYAFIGMSQIREGSKDFSNLEVEENSNFAGIIIFDMELCEVVGKILYHSTVEEIFDVKVLDYQKPAIIRSADERSKQIIYFANQVFWRKMAVKEPQDI